MVNYSQQTTYSFVSAISSLMMAIRSSSEDGKQKEQTQSSVVNQRFKFLLNDISDSLHNISHLYDETNDIEQQASHINYHIEMVTISIRNLHTLEEYSNNLQLHNFNSALQKILDSLKLMKKETQSSQ